MGSVLTSCSSWAATPLSFWDCFSSTCFLWEKTRNVWFLHQVIKSACQWHAKSIRNHDKSYFERYFVKIAQNDPYTHAKNMVCWKVQKIDFSIELTTLANSPIQWYAKIAKNSKIVISFDFRIKSTLLWHILLVKVKCAK